MEFGPDVDSPLTMAHRLARCGYRVDTINASLLNSFGRTIDRGHIKELVANESARNTRAAANAPKVKLGLMQADEAYRANMYEANRIFVSRLLAEMAA